jgi:diguanylate cyclase (GGDEF)-like protein
VRAAVLRLCLPHITSAHMIVTVSIGVAAAKPNEALRPGDLIEAADAALYAAKHRGRNKVVEHGVEAIETGAADMMMAG